MLYVIVGIIGLATFVDRMQIANELAMEVANANR